MLHRDGRISALFLLEHDEKLQGYDGRSFTSPWKPQAFHLRYASQVGVSLGGAGLSGGEGADVAGTVIPAGLYPHEMLFGNGACWTAAVAAAGASPEPLLPSEGTEKTESNAVLGVGQIDGQSRWRSIVVPER